MNVLFLKSKTFLAREVENALKKRVDIRPVITAIPEHLPRKAFPRFLNKSNSIFPPLSFR